MLVANLRRLEYAVKAGADKLSTPFLMSETHSLMNPRKTHAQMLQEIERCVELLTSRAPD